jgi:hypothetical protein
MKLSQAFLNRREDPQAKREERDHNGEIVPPCVGGGEHRRWIRYKSTLKCALCGQVKYSPQGWR